MRERVSIHAPHEGERPCRDCVYARPIKFQSTLPTRGSDGVENAGKWMFLEFQSTLPTRGSDLRLSAARTPTKHVSIHAPHEGERPVLDDAANAIAWMFQSTLPTRGSDCRMPDLSAPILTFQSTLPTRGSDDCSAGWGYAPSCFNPRSPRGGATSSSVGSFFFFLVSIHAPHEGERLSNWLYNHRLKYVSIHAPHEGERRNPSFAQFNNFCVSIHAPHEGERLHCCLILID